MEAFNSEDSQSEPTTCGSMMKTVQNLWTSLEQKMRSSQWRLSSHHRLPSVPAKASDFQLQLSHKLITMILRMAGIFPNIFGIFPNTAECTWFNGQIIRETINGEPNWVLVWIMRRNCCKHKKLLHLPVSLTFHAQASGRHWQRSLESTISW